MFLLVINIGDEYIGCIAKTIKVFSTKYRITGGRCGGGMNFI
jgi:hypothetical protein